MSAVRPGYKQTEVGVIPEDWDVEPLGARCKLINGRGFKPFEWSDQGLPIIRIQNLNGSDEFNYFTGLYNKKIEIETGQLLFAWSGSRGTSFGPHIWKGPRAVLNYHIWKMVHDAERVDKPYFQHALRRLTTEIEASAHGASALVHTQKSEMEKYLLPLPPLPEQQAIAEALGDADALIEALEALIAKKRDIKQGAMQDLLTGTRRLPGFQGEWIERQLGSLGSFAKGSGVKKDESNSGPLPCVRYGELYTHHTDIIRRFNSHISAEVAKGALRLRAGDVLFAGSGETKEEIGRCAALVEDVEAYAGGDIVVLRPSDSAADFLGYYLNMPGVQRQKASRGQGDAVVHISSRALASIDLKLPPTLAEQRAIAAVLLDMDAEIAALEAKLAKVLDVKQGMMQVLLTGEIRLV